VSQNPLYNQQQQQYDPYNTSQYGEESLVDANGNYGGSYGNNSSSSANSARLRTPHRSELKIDHPYDEKLMVEPPNLFAQNLTVPKLEELQCKFLFISLFSFLFFFF
jgi:hypothetical protein